MNAKVYLPVLLVTLTLGGTSAGAIAPDLPIHDVESAQASASHTVCRDSGGLCAHASVTGTLAGCTPEEEAYSCNVLYTLSVAAEGNGCFYAAAEPTGSMIGCTALGLPFLSFPPLTATKTYEGVALDSTIREDVLLCVDHPLLTKKCEQFALTLRLPTGGALAASGGLSVVRMGEASATICREPAEAAAECASIHVLGHVTGCEANGHCQIMYRITHTMSGADGCSSGTFSDGLYTRTVCSEDAQPGVAYTRVVRTSFYGNALSVHEEGTLCLDGATPRCESFDIDIPLQ